MDNITMQNHFYEMQAINPENESGNERRLLEMAYRPEVKTEMKQEAPTSSFPPEASSQHKLDRHNSSIARGLMRKTGDGGTLNTERIRGGDLLSFRLKKVKMTFIH